VHSNKKKQVTDSVERCRACGTKTDYLWQGQLLDQSVGYFECAKCRYVQTEEPHWLEQAYREVINVSDTGVMARNIYNSRVVLATMAAMGSLDQPIVDGAGGYGILVRLLRDYGIDAYWQDLYCQNLVARGFEYPPDETQRASLVVEFEVFEHFVQPDREIEELLLIAPNILLSTLLIPDPTPEQNKWWYYGKEHGQHIGFFRKETLSFLAEKHGKHLLSIGQYHLLTENPVNSLLWKLLVASNKVLPTLLRYRLKSKTWPDHIKSAKPDHHAMEEP